MTLYNQIEKTVMTEVGTAIPANVNLAKSKPFAVTAYTRRVKSIATNAQAFGPSMDVNIQFETSTPGSFIDPLQSYLKFDLTIINSNPYIDYVSFGKAGAASIIEEFRVMIAGVPVEEILQYNLFYELMMNQSGQVQQPMYLYRQSTVKQNVDELFHANAIKSPMVGLGGSPMFGVGCTNNMSQPHTNYVTSNTKQIQTLRLSGSQATGFRTIHQQLTQPANSNSKITDLNVASRNLQNKVETLLQGQKNVATGSGYALYRSDGSYPSVFCSSEGYGALPPFASLVETSTFSPFALPAIDLDPYNAFNWPFVMPLSMDRPDAKTLGPDNLQDYFMFLANVKNIPVGIKGSDRNNRNSDPSRDGVPSQGVWSSLNFRNYDVLPSGTTSTITYTACVPLISGILGCFAEKMWPTMLIAPGTMYIQIKLAPAEKAFKVSMDPARRVLGTIRDYMPWGGTFGGLFGQYSSRASTGANAHYYVGDNANELAHGFIPGYIANNEVYGFQRQLDQTLNSFNADSGVNVDDTNEAVGTTPLNAFSVIGANLASANVNLSTYMTNGHLGEINEDDVAGLCFRPYGKAAMEGRWAKAQNSTVINSIYSTTQNALNPNTFNTTSAADLNQYDMTLLPDSVGQNTAVTINSSQNSALNSVAFMGPAGIPLPQYYLTARPWASRRFWVELSDGTFTFRGDTTPAPCSEATACYGTYLPSSVAQSRRCFLHNNTPVTYRVTNVEYVTQQIILPEAVAANILSLAAAGDISISSTSVHNYQTPIVQSLSQNLIIPAKIASANTLYCLFVPQAFVSGNTAQLYNSLRGVNPFAAISNRAFGDLLDVTNYGQLGSSQRLGFNDGYVSVYNTPCTGGPFQVQLRIGNELTPHTPIVNMSELLTENIKAAHKLFDTSSNVDCAFSVTDRRSQYYEWNSTTGTLNDQMGLSYNCLRDGEFCTTFVHVNYMDDQTAVHNPAMNLVLDAYATKNRLPTLKVDQYFIERGQYNLPMFTPPESTFVMAFDMETWSRYSDVSRSGKYLGQNTLTLNMQGATLLGEDQNRIGSQGFMLQSFVVHDVRYSIMAGGLVQAYI